MDIVRRMWIRTGLALVLAVFLAGCGDDNKGSGTSGSSQTAPIDLTIVAGSECKALQPLFDQFQSEHNVHLSLQYTGSLDISQDLDSDNPPADAYMPSNTLWITLGDTHKHVKDVKSIARTYVVFGIKEPVAKSLGWEGRKVTVSDILQEAQAGKLRYMMTSATQSNSGASAYIGYLYAFAGHPEVLTPKDLKKPDVQTKIKAILGTVNRSAGSSGFLKDLFLQRYDDFDGMVNYESVIIETNKELVAQHKDPLYVVYPSDGLSIADYPLGFVDHGDAAKKKLFDDLQTFLLSQPAQSQIASLGWRTSPIGMQVQNADPSVFNPAWGIDTKRVFSPIRLPDAATIQEALTLYQTTFRKPSFTVYALDFSGSMGDNGGVDGLKAGVSQIISPDKSSRLFLQASPKDVNVIIPFSDHDHKWEEMRVVGNDPNALNGLVAKVNTLQPSGGTDFYSALTRALEIVRAQPGIENYSAAIILMTDGQDNQGQKARYEDALRAAGSHASVPIYALTYGEADTSQLGPIADETSGKIFGGKDDLKRAFRDVKGYN